MGSTWDMRISEQAICCRRMGRFEKEYKFQASLYLSCQYQCQYRSKTVFLMSVWSESIVCAILLDVLLVMRTEYEIENDVSC